MTETSVLIVDPVSDGVVLLTLNRPQRRNALSAQLRSELVRVLGELAGDDSCRAVVLTGGAGTFCAGFDLKELQESDSPGDVFADAEEYHHEVHTFAKPMIAAISGPALAGGCDLAAMCDIRIAQRDATFGQPQVRFGVPAAYDLMRSILPESVARELCLTGDTIDAAEALRIGLVNHVVDDCVEHAVALATVIAGVPAAGEVERLILAAQPSLFEAGAPGSGSHPTIPSD